MGGTQISGRSDPLGFSHGFSLHADTVAYANPVVEATLGGAEVDLGRSRTHTPHIPTCAQAFRDSCVHTLHAHTHPQR